jgi:TRAP-type mannitol/chloroaromatic compound transport system permease small subunit
MRVIDRDEGSLEMSEGLQRMLEVVARASGWLLVMEAATCFDVLARKARLPVPLTRLQELEWHFHARCSRSGWATATDQGASLHEDAEASAQGLD